MFILITTQKVVHHDRTLTNLHDIQPRRLHQPAITADRHMCDEIERLREAIQDLIEYLKEYSYLPVSGYALLGELIQILKTEVKND